MRRREALLALVGLGAAFGSRVARAQTSGRRYRIGLLSNSPGPYLEEFVRALERLGYVEGRNITLERRSAEGRSGRLASLAAELVRLDVDVLVAPDPPSAIAAKAATSAIPIVMRSSDDPVRGRLVATLAHPGGNITGVYSLNEELTAKRLGILKEAISGLARVGVLWNSTFAGSVRSWRTLEGAAKSTGVQLHSMDVADAGRLEGAFRGARNAGCAAVLTLRNPLIVVQRRRVIALALQNRLPTMFDEREFVEDGGLMSYGTDLADLYGRLAAYVDRILKGARPGDMPVEQAAKFELMLNLRTARALGIAIPQPILLRADRLIE